MNRASSDHQPPSIGAVRTFVPRRVQANLPKYVVLPKCQKIKSCYQNRPPHLPVTTYLPPRIMMYHHPYHWHHLYRRGHGLPHQYRPRHLKHIHILLQVLPAPYLCRVVLPLLSSHPLPKSYILVQIYVIRWALNSGVSVLSSVAVGCSLVHMIPSTVIGIIIRDVQGLPTSLPSPNAHLVFHSVGVVMVLLS